MGATVVIGCKLQNGIWMENIVPPKDPRQLQPNPGGRKIEIKGANSLIVKNTNPGIGQVAYTTVDKEFADKWFEDHKDAAMVTGGMIFKAENMANAQAEGKDVLKELTGLEPLNPSGDKRTQRSIEPDREHLSRLTGVAA